MSGFLRYRVRHETVYYYGGDVAHSRQLLHLTPRNTPYQTCYARNITLQPQPSTRSENADAFGNWVTQLEYDLPHDRLEVLAEVGVEVHPLPGIVAADSEPWENVCAALRYSGRALTGDLLEASRFRMESSYIRVKHAFTEYGEDCFQRQCHALAAAEALMHKIHREFSYAPGSTNVRTSALEALEVRQGVCQDYAHIMIACLRARGLAARYVSGYLHTLPPPGADEAYVGADASHAWVSVFCPPFGWVDLDPTNDMRMSAGHIVVAWGRDFGDVSPLRGVIVGGGQHRLSVRVSVQAE